MSSSIIKASLILSTIWFRSEYCKELSLDKLGFKKDVLTKIHGGGATDRKRKLLEKQKKGKARSKQFGRVEIPQEAFIGVLKISKEK